MLVYVIGKSGHPLMPSTRNGHIRWLLKTKQAKVVRMKPFTVRLLYDTPEKTQMLVAGTDPGRTNIGEAVLKEDGEAVFAAHIATRNEQVPKLMKKRATHRWASRQGERKRRQRRAKKYKSTTTPEVRDRILSGCEEPIHNHFIKNTEARFNNRKRPSGWLTPTATQLLRTHLNMVDKMRAILPITDWCMEVNKFAFMRMEDGSIRGIDFQNGRLKGYKNVEDYIFAIQNGKCACCGKPIACYHHIVPRHKGGSDGPENRVGLCEDCHGKVHTGKLDAVIEKIGQKKKYAALSILNQIIPYFYKGLVDRFGEEHVHLCYGYETQGIRTRSALLKAHHTDAMCIASTFLKCNPYLGDASVYEIQQFRRHNWAIINNQRERTYKLDGKTVAKNRRPRFEQKEPSLQDFLNTLPAKERASVCSKLKVIKSTRSYHNIYRPYIPGDVFFYNGKRYILSRQHSKGNYVCAFGDKTTNYPSRDCRFVKAGGLVYL